MPEGRKQSARNFLVQAEVASRVMAEVAPPGPGDVHDERNGADVARVVGTRVALRDLEEDADWIEAETGYSGVVEGLTGVIVGIEGENERHTYYEVELDRNGERLVFIESELRSL